MKPRRMIGIAVFVTMIALGGAARAEDLDRRLSALLDRRAADLALTIGKRSLRRGRRAFALGPLVGAAPAMSTDGDFDVQLSAGLGLVRYDISIFISSDQIIEMIKSRARRLLLERVVAGSTPTEADVERVLAEVIEEVKSELLGELRPRRFERPRFKLSLEADHLARADAWGARATLGVGVSRVFVATGLVGRADDGFAVIVPLELSLPMLLSDGLRSPAVEWLIRLDVPVTDRAGRSDQVMLGARLVLDVI